MRQSINFIENIQSNFIMRKKKNINIEIQEQNNIIQHISKRQKRETNINVFKAKNYKLPEKNIKAVEKIRQSGHYVDQKLKHNKPSDVQLNIFDTLEAKTIDKINKINNEDDKTIMIPEGIKLTVAEDKLMNTLLNKLYEKSNVKVNNKNRPDEPDKFYKGNIPAEAKKYGGKVITPARIRLTAHELFTELTGTKEYSGQEIQYYNNILSSLRDKNFLIIYKRYREEKNGNRTETKIDRIEEYQPILKIDKYYESLTEKEDRDLDLKDSLTNVKGDIIITFNPIITDQINVKWVSYPKDINERTEKASGGAYKVTKAIINLRDFLLRAISNKNYTITIDKENMPYLLGLDKYIKEGRKKLINKRIEESIRAVINLGLAIEVTDTKGVRYQPQYRFTLNSDFCK